MICAFYMMVFRIRFIYNFILELGISHEKFFMSSSPMAHRCWLMCFHMLNCRCCACISKTFLYFIIFCVTWLMIQKGKRDHIMCISSLMTVVLLHKFDLLAITNSLIGDRKIFLMLYMLKAIKSRIRHHNKKKKKWSVALELWIVDYFLGFMQAVILTMLWICIRKNNFMKIPCQWCNLGTSLLVLLFKDLSSSSLLFIYVFTHINFHLYWNDAICRWADLLGLI